MPLANSIGVSINDVVLLIMPKANTDKPKKIWLAIKNYHALQPISSSTINRLMTGELFRGSHC